MQSHLPQTQMPWPLHTSPLLDMQVSVRVVQLQ